MTLGSRPCYRIGICDFTSVWSLNSAQSFFSTWGSQTSQRFVHPPATRAKPYKLWSISILRSTSVIFLDNYWYNLMCCHKASFEFTHLWLITWASERLLWHKALLNATKQCRHLDLLWQYRGGKSHNTTPQNNYPPLMSIMRSRYYIPVVLHRGSVFGTVSVQFEYLVYARVLFGIVQRTFHV